MELGEKLRQARLEAGLSQRQLCADIVTRNMLSLIENGSAKPSMETLKLLAARLGKSVSFFLEEDAVTSPNLEIMEGARTLLDAGDHAGALDMLETYRCPDPVFDREQQLLRKLCCLALAEQALEEGRQPYALELLTRAEQNTGYCREELERRRLLLLGRIPGKKVAAQLPSLDEELMLRSEEAFAVKDYRRAEQLLDAAQDRESPRWNLLRGRIFVKRGNFREAADCLQKAEDTYPKAAYPLLERCFRELEDYKRAYEYACKAR